MQHTTNYNLNVIEQSDKILDSVTALGNNATSLDSILIDKLDTSKITYSTTDLTAGTSPLATGSFYFVYE